MNAQHLKIMLILIGAFTLAGCSKEVANQNNKPVSVDSLNAIFVASWNNKDSLAAVSIVSENAIVMDDSLIHQGVDEIGRNWISRGIKVVGNIKTVSASQGANEQIAYDGGTYNLELTIPGGPLLTEKGNYSFVWTKTTENEWKLTLIHIEPVTRMPKVN